MDAFLGKLTQQAVNYAIRSGITITAGYAIGQCSRLLKTVDGSSLRDELMTLQERLDTKIRIISPAIDLIELISARGNTTLESAVSLTKRIRWDIQSLGQRLAKAAEAEEASRNVTKRSKTHAVHETEIKRIVNDMRRLLTRIEDAVPLINLAITTSGAGLTTQLPPSVSPSRLLQASRFLGEGDYRYSQNPGIPTQIGPSFILSLYMLFSAHSRSRTFDSEDGPRQSTWKEVLHKSHVRLVRVPLPDSAKVDEEMRLVHNNNDASLNDHRMNEYYYRLEMNEDLDDDRVHTSEDGIDPISIKESFPVHQVSRIFYADTGKILNIGADSERNSPILLLKRDVLAQPPRRMMESDEVGGTFNYASEVQNIPTQVMSDDEDSQDDINAQLHHESSSSHLQSGHTITTVDRSLFPPNLDPEWLAFEVYMAEEESMSEYGDDDQDVEEDASDTIGTEESGIPDFIVEQSDSESESELDRKLKELAVASPKSADRSQIQHTSQGAAPMYGVAKNSLSLLEVLLRLTVLQQFQQQNHLEIPDELLTFFLQESSTTGMDEKQRRRMRREARTKVGFDPYDESPIKRHGEDYQRNYYDDRPYSRSGTPYSRSGTPMRASTTRGHSSRSQTPLQNDSFEKESSRQKRHAHSPRPPASVESRYPSLNVYQTSPLAKKNGPQVIDSLSKSRLKSSDTTASSKLHIASSVEDEEDSTSETSQ